MRGCFVDGVLCPNRRRGREQVKEFVGQDDFGDLFAGEPVLLSFGDRRGGEAFNCLIVQRDLHRLPRAFSELNYSPGGDVPRSVMNSDAQTCREFARGEVAILFPQLLHQRRVTP